MNKSLLKLFAIFAIVGMAFIGCQKEDDFTNKNLDEGVLIKRDTVFRILKGAVITKYDYVYVLQENGSLVKHKTIKIRDLQWKIVQEWFLEDLKTTAIQDPKFYPGDDGSVHGYYYRWENQITDVADNNGWKYLVCADKNYTEFDRPFRLPRIQRYYCELGDDLRLGQLLGSTYAIKSKLQLQDDGYYNAHIPIFKKGVSCFWLETRRTCTPHNSEHCGVLSTWNNNGSYYLHGLSLPNVYANVRLMRDIRKSDW